MENIESIDRNAHYFILMNPLEILFIPDHGAIKFTSSNTRQKWVECVVNDNPKLNDKYKIELKSLEFGYGKETYYIEDFLSLLNKGYIVKKEPGMECVEEHWIEPLSGKTYLHHSAYTLKLTNNKKKS